MFWLLPWMTVWRVLNRFRAVAEHGGMQRSPDRRLTTHHVRQSFWPRFWMVPFNTGWHLAHHVDIGVPFSNLPAFHAELERCGYSRPASSGRTTEACGPTPAPAAPAGSVRESLRRSRDTERS